MKNKGNRRILLFKNHKSIRIKTNPGYKPKLMKHVSYKRRTTTQQKHVNATHTETKYKITIAIFMTCLNMFKVQYCIEISSLYNIDY